MEPKKLNLEDFNLVNDLELVDVLDDDVNESTVEVPGLGNVGSFKYAYNDICSNAMK